MKDNLLALARQQASDLTALQKSVRSITGRQIQQRPPLDAGAATARFWFDTVRPALEKAGFSPSTITVFSERFETILRASSGRPTKTSYLTTISATLAAYKVEVIHQIEVGSFTATTGLSIAPYIEGLPVDEGDYLDEAQRCLSANALRGCIVLGWCATIARIHATIQEIGFGRFSEATEEMHAKTVGRFKPFKKKFAVESMSDLQRVFDTDMLWVLEYLQLIDGNQHERLRHCFEMRNNSAHPGLAPITGENLYSFFSDITHIVLKNPKFQLGPQAPQQ